MDIEVPCGRRRTLHDLDGFVSSPRHMTRRQSLGMSCFVDDDSERLGPASGSAGVAKGRGAYIKINVCATRRHSGAYADLGIGVGPALVCAISREESWNRFSFSRVTSQLRRPNDTWAASRNSERLSTTSLGWKRCERPFTQRGLLDSGERLQLSDLCMNRASGLFTGTLSSARPPQAEGFAHIPGLLITGYSPTLRISADALRHCFA